jgi:hypothetical protein
MVLSLDSSLYGCNRSIELSTSIITSACGNVDQKVVEIRTVHVESICGSTTACTYSTKHLLSLPYDCECIQYRIYRTTTRKEVAFVRYCKVQRYYGTVYYIKLATANRAFTILMYTWVHSVCCNEATVL